ncbi:MAG: hypothetical protein LBQ12_00815 [Deltaproteobacteria bacterium]|nr:hypothetical protein [Deltaproteobacteria bacterium]
MGRGMRSWSEGRRPRGRVKGATDLGGGEMVFYPVNGYAPVSVHGG